jgi:hypothetical protein
LGCFLARLVKISVKTCTEVWNSLCGTSEDGLVAVVDPEDLKSFAKLGREAQASAQGHVAIGQNAIRGVCRPGANARAVWYRASMLGLCDRFGLLAGYKRDGEFTDAVFHAAATFPMKRMEVGVTYDGLPFDTEEFISQIERASR